MPTLILTRPAGLNAKTAAKAEAAGIKTIQAPLMVIESIPHVLPQDAHEALLLTSVQAVPAAAPCVHLPVYAVGPVTAEAARKAGFKVVAEGATDGRAIVQTAFKQGVRRLLHLRGEDGAELSPPAELQITTIPVYRAVLATSLSKEAHTALSHPQNVIIALFSPRAAACFARLVDQTNLPREQISLITISENATKAAGADWKATATAAKPTTEAMLAAASQLWQEHGQ